MSDHCPTSPDDKELWHALHQRLKTIARKQLSGESNRGLLQPTALINEAWLRMADLQLEWNSHQHFLAMAAKVMRRVLVDQARANKAGKRDARLRVTFNSALVNDQPNVDFLEVHDAIDALGQLDERKAAVIEMFYFGGMSYDEIGGVFGISQATIKRELRTAKAWLLARLESDSKS